uniref:CTNNB1_binding domain-containing protein n=1 Tax=Heterorhabditis bacteriophora TaxID=37862 RepID=A0A1I7WUQ8_HETBA
MEAAAHLEQVEKTGDASESDSDEGPSRNSLLTMGRQQYGDEKAELSINQQRPLMDHNTVSMNMHITGNFVLPTNTKIYRD